MNRFASAFRLSLILLPLASCATLDLDEVPRRDYVALGDSVTAGVGAGGTVDLDDPAASIDRRAAYPHILADTYGVRYANLAVPGAMADDVLRLQAAPAIGLRPRVVTLWVGGNDLVHARTAE